MRRVLLAAILGLVACGGSTGNDGQTYQPANSEIGWSFEANGVHCLGGTGFVYYAPAEGDRTCAWDCVTYEGQTVDVSVHFLNPDPGNAATWDVESITTSGC